MGRHLRGDQKQGDQLWQVARDYTDCGRPEERGQQTQHGKAGETQGQNAKGDVATLV